MSAGWCSLAGRTHGYDSSEMACLNCGRCLWTKPQASKELRQLYTVNRQSGLVAVEKEEGGAITYTREEMQILNGKIPPAIHDVKKIFNNALVQYAGAPVELDQI